MKSSVVPQRPRGLGIDEMGDEMKLWRQMSVDPSRLYVRLIHKVKIRKKERKKERKKRKKRHVVPEGDIE